MYETTGRPFDGLCHGPGPGGLHSLYERQSLTDSAIDQLLVLDVRGQDFFSSHGFSDQHAGGQAFAHDPAVMGWLFSH